MNPDGTIESRLLGGELSLPGGEVTLRLRRLAGRWLATATGPLGQVELGADASPYLAAQVALETWQPDVVTVMLAVGRLRPVEIEVEADGGAEAITTPAQSTPRLAGR